jgi:DNA gyrase subunit A
VQVFDGDEIMLISDKGTLVRTRVDEISVQGRNTQGVRLIKLKEGETLVGVERVEEPEEGAQMTTRQLDLGVGQASDAEAGDAGDELDEADDALDDEAGAEPDDAVDDDAGDESDGESDAEPGND